MDHDLLLDIFAFQPEKYFISRMLLPSSRTRISFVDYERSHYFLKKFSDSMNWLSMKHIVSYQEYGPSYYSPKFFHMWSDKNGEIHRENGPAILCRETICYIMDRGDKWDLWSDHWNITIPSGKITLDDAYNIEAIWFHHEEFRAIRTKSGKFIKVPC